MLKQANEPPGRRLSATNPAPLDAPAVSANLLSLHVNKFSPASYLAVEGYRLYPISIDIKSLFEDYISRIQAPLSDYTFANNIIWLSRMSGFYQIIEDCFCLFSLNGDGLTMLLPPLGYAANQHRALQSCFEIMDGYNATPYVGKVEYVYRDFLDVMDLNPDETVFPTVSSERWLVERSLPDYIYRTEDLIGLKGNAYKSKRGEINQFRRSYPNHRMEILGPQHWEGIHNLVNTWLQNRLKYTTPDSVADFFFTVESERAAVTRALEHYDFLRLQGLCLIIGGRLEGFTFGERITLDVASVLVEKTNFTIPGSAQYLFREFAKTYVDCTYINVGDDLGLENLRKVKMSYRPALFGEKFTLRRHSV